ncbi:hypothetical protein EAI_09130 [Harpegnathos saltator]|uniref:Uncharacterized protein n=1 Tax=Harpegnathos saltator TaxID=610380 RepID=E2C2L9_HARSA|nr:hypothetical protein EAI_09130 [Harpegnathos saltator]
MSVAIVNADFKKTSNSFSTKVGNERNILLCKTYALNNSDTKRVQVGLRTMFDVGTFEPAIKIMGNTASEILLDLNTWEKFKDIIPSANSYLCWENKDIPALIFINDITISFTSTYAAWAIMVSQREEMAGESGPAMKTLEDSTHLKQSLLKKRKLYTENIIMQKTSFDGLEIIVKCIDVRYEYLQSVAALVNNCNFNIRDRA